MIESFRTHASTSLWRTSAGVLCLASNGDWRSRSLKKYLKFESARITLAVWAVSYFTDQLMTLYFSGGSTINGTPGGDRWVRGLGGKIGWLSESLHLVDADCSGSPAASGRVLVHECENTNPWKTRKNLPRPKHPQQLGDPDHLETACHETRTTR